MGLGDFFDRIINGPVGNNFDNEDEDVRQVRRGLEETGYLNGEEKEREDSGRELGIITRNLDAGIKRFQRDHGLKEDGYLKPGGETESALARRLNEKREAGVRSLRERLNSSTRRGEEKNRSKQTIKPRPSPLRINEEEIFRQYLLAQAEKKEPADKPAEPSRANTPPKPERKPPNPVLSAALKKAEKDLKIFDKKDYKLSSKFLRHYLAGSGHPLTLSVRDIESAKLYRKAIRTNQKRFEESMTKGLVDEKFISHKEGARTGTTSLMKKQILKLKDGETMRLDNPEVKGTSDFWDRDIGRIESVLNDPDHGRALGAVKLRSLGDLQATRTGDKIEITGVVNHEIRDTYDFNDDTLFDKKAFERYRLLAEEGNAKPFQVYGRKPQKIKGVLEIKNGRIISSEFEWENIRE